MWFEKSSTATPFFAEILKDGVGVTGLTVTVAIRKADTADTYLDFADGTMKTSGRTTKNAACTELGTGRYHKVQNLNTAAGFVTGGVYCAEFTFSGSESGTLSEIFKIRELVQRVEETATALAVVDAIVDDILAKSTLLRKHLTNRLVETAGDPGTLVLKDDDDTTDLLSWNLTDKDNAEVVGVAGAPARRSKATGTY